MPADERRTAPAGVDYSALYDEHPDYVARRASGSFEQAQIDIEVRLFKLPQLMRLLPPGRALNSASESPLCKTNCGTRSGNSLNTPVMPLPVRSAN